MNVFTHFGIALPPDGVDLHDWMKTLPPSVLSATQRECPSLSGNFATVGDYLSYVADTSAKCLAELDSGEIAILPVPHPSPLVLSDWIVHQRTETGGYYIQKGKNPLGVKLSCCRERDGKRWLHVSARRSGLPTYDDLCLVKKIFIGPDKTAYQLFVPTDKHVNEHSHVLHLWHCLDGDVTPDFRKGGSI